ncbi:MAG: amino acid racemase [Bacteroidota bacterium]
MKGTDQKRRSTKKVGIVGGMGARAGSDFFSKLVEYAPALTDQEFPEVFIHSNSRIPDRTKAIVYGEASSLPEILRSVKILDQNEVDLVAMACITSYHYYPEVIKHTKANVLHPVELTARFIRKNYPDRTKVGLLATTGTIKSGLFHQIYDEYGLEPVLLDEEDQENFFMTSVYMDNGLKSSVISQEARDLFMFTIPRLKAKGAEVMVGGCSEVQLVIKQSMLDIPYVDAIDLMVKEIVDKCYHLSDGQVIHEPLKV